MTLIAAPRAVAQSAATARTGATRALEPCSYDACALRLEDATLIRGIEGRVAGSLSFSGDLAQSVPWRSDSARVLAGRAQERHRTGVILQTLGTVSAFAGVLLQVVALQEETDRARIVAASNTSSSVVSISRPKLYTALGLAIGGTIVGLIGNAVDSKAHKLLARAVWWNNRELVR